MIVLPETPSFRKPPVIEVSFGMQFARLEQWQTRYFGDFWNQVKTSFPVSADAAPLEVVNVGLPKLEMSFLPPLRRVLFYSEDQSTLLQVQDNRFHLNWRKIRAEDTYPRFARVFALFKEWLAVYRDFAKEKDLGEVNPQRYELTYINHIDTAGDFSRALEENVKLFNWTRVAPKYLSAPKTVGAVWQFDMKDGLGTMNANLTHARNAEGNDLLVLGLNCVGEKVETVTLDQWFEAAHRSIVFGFTDLTTEEAHHLWGRER